MGLFDGAAGAGRAGVDRARRQAAAGAGGAGGGRLVAVPLGGRAGARLRLLGPGGAARRRDPQQGRLGPARGAAARGAGRVGVPVLGVLRRDAAAGHARPGTSAWCRSPNAAPRRVRVGRARWPRWSRAGCDLRRAAGAGPHRPAAGRPTPWDPAAEPAPAAAAAPGAARGRRRRRPRVHLLATPSTPNCCAAAGAEVVAVRPAARRGAAGRHRAGWSSAAASPRCTRRSCRPTSRCARRSPRWPPRGAPVAAECAGLLYLSRALDGAPMCGVLDAEAPDDRPADAGLPGGGRACGDSVAGRGRDPGARARVPPHACWSRAPGADPAWGLTRPERRAEGFVTRRACTPPTCTCTGPPCRRWPGGWWRARRGAGPRGA